VTGASREVVCRTADTSREQNIPVETRRAQKIPVKRPEDTSRDQKTPVKRPEYPRR